VSAGLDAQPAAEAPPSVVPLDPASPRGIEAANDLSDVFADVITRLRSEGKPVPDLSADPA
jgi:hypothetical protein